jgi:hypothetical protein
VFWPAPPRVGGVRDATEAAHDPPVSGALVDGGGNIPPELHAVRRLVERGHVVTVIAEDSIADEVRATGATLRRR